MNQDDRTLSSKLMLREARLFHTINFGDFGEYCKQSSILSRFELAELYPNYTRFFSDEKDKKPGVWNKTFGNLIDFGKYFWKYERAIPNAYGPITIVLRPMCWDSLSDLRLTRRTITAEENEDITAERFDEICEQRNGQLVFVDGYKAIEVSSNNPRLAFEHLAYILVEPISVGGRRLRKHVVDKLRSTGHTAQVITDNQVIERRMELIGSNARMIRLLAWSSALGGKLINDNEPLEKSVPDDLSAWLSNLEDWKKHILASWLTYTYNGTLRWLER